MPIKIPEDLPAFDVLSREGVMVMSEQTANRQDIRPLRIGLLNLMPKKIQAETQFARLIGATPLQIELSLIRMSEHQTKNTSAEHMESFYRPFSEVKGEYFDGLIITGAPVEQLPFEDVTYWRELCEVFEWTQSHVHSTFAVCWGGMAMINYFNQVPKHALETKAFGCFAHQSVVDTSPYLRGFADQFTIPVSRWTEIRREDIAERPDLNLLIDSQAVGPCLVEDPNRRAIYIFNHLEYDSNTLGDEYARDKEAGMATEPPLNYFPNDDVTRTPENHWRSHAHLLYGNWINQIYQTTSFDISKVGQ